MQLSFGTWNLDRSGVRSKTRWGDQLKEIRRRDCDVWVLTEAHRQQQLPEGMQGAFSAPGRGIYHVHECAVAVWTRWPARSVQVANARLSACVEIEPVVGKVKVLVYGTVIPYADDGVRSGSVQRWQRHREAVAAVVADCVRLRREHPQSTLVLAGDFNMNLDGTHWYGLNEVKSQLQLGLASAGMFCCTPQDIRKDRSFNRANVDHVWAGVGATLSGAPQYWFNELSDHNGVNLRLVVPS